MYRVIVVDDSKFYRQYLEEIINSFEDFEVVVTAEDAYDARDKIKEYKPDLVTIDINMPKMDGIAFLKNLMRLHPMPAIIVSTEAHRHKEAYEDGALGFIEKASYTEDTNSFIKRLKNMLLSFTYLYDRYRNQGFAKNSDDSQSKLSPDILLKSKPARSSSHKAIAIAASTGGIEAISNIVSKLPNSTPPIFIVQHIPHGFSKSFIQRLNTLTELNVVEVENHQIIKNSTIYLAKGNHHLLVSPSLRPAEMGFVDILDGPRISRHCPSADIMFRSINNTFGKGALGVILTGMGDDGVIGLKELRENGAKTIGQDEQTSVVFGMPKKALEIGAIDEVYNLDTIIKKINQFNTNYN